MMQRSITRSLFPGQVAALVLASAFGIPALAQQDQSQPAATPQTTSSSTAQPSPQALPNPSATKEGFWGRMNPFARQKWVHKQVDPIKDRLSELDELNAKNAKDIQDVDSRAQAGIKQAQSTADQANQTATAAGTQAQQAGDTAKGASQHVDSINTTVQGLDQYKQINEVDVAFRGGQPTLSKDAKAELDTLAASVTGHQGYILEIEAHSPAHGAVGIENSAKLADAVKRYLVTEHQIPVYRLHAVAMGNAQVQTASTDEAMPATPSGTTGTPSGATGSSSGTMASGAEQQKPVHAKSEVHIRVMENSLAAQDSTSPHGVASMNGAERP